MSLPNPRPWPVPMWPEFWPWAGWKLANPPVAQPPIARTLQARYERETRQQGKPRYGVPPWAWVRLSYMKTRPSVPISQARNLPPPYNGKGMFLLEPRGGTEDIGAWKNAGGTYVLLNIAGAGSWGTHLDRCLRLGIAPVPWRRLLNPGEPTRYAYERIAEIEETARSWESRGAKDVAYNLEGEAQSQFVPGELLDATLGYKNRHRAVITEPWMQNAPGGMDWGWKPLGDAGWVAINEAFLNGNPSWDPTVLTQHAKNEGMPLAIPAFGWGVWSDAPLVVLPSEYKSRWKGPYTVYFGDGREPLYHLWS